MNLLVVGGGGREHAIIKALKKSPEAEKIWCIPGNGGIAREAQCVPLKATDIEGIVEFCKKNPVDYAIVAPDDPLAMGLVDMLEAEGIPAFGPRKNAAVIEASKIFSKNLMKKYNIPTASYEIFDDSAAAYAYIEKKGAPIVIKADGLALGKGVTVAKTIEDAKKAVSDMMEDRLFGNSGSRVVIEEFMEGPEVTVLCFTDGKNIAPMPASQDHKRAFTDDAGPNTGGMGAVSPVPCYTPEIAKECMTGIFLPTIRAMEKEGRIFKGVLYFGLMLTKKGPRVIEYNARFGDPEAQTVLPLLETDLLSVMLSVTEERLVPDDIKWKDAASCCVVLASGGYPGAYETGFEISGLAPFNSSDNKKSAVLQSSGVSVDITVFHAGTKAENGKILTSGGRVLGITSVAATLEDAISGAYENIKEINFKNMQYRLDIGKKALAEQN